MLGEHAGQSLVEALTAAFRGYRQHLGRAGGQSVSAIIRRFDWWGIHHA
jgi:hypothetical protein